MLEISKEIKQTDYDEASYWQMAVLLGYPTALWRLPDEKNLHLLSTFSSRPRQTKIDLEYLPAGFAVAPFDNPEGKNTYFLPADLHLTFDDEHQLVSEKFSKKFSGEWQHLRQKLNEQAARSHSPDFTATVVEDNAAEKKQFTQSVEKAIQVIRNGKLQKVVLSRRKQYQLSEGFEIVTLFNRLCDAYPTAFVSAVFLPHLNEIWVGASPETLVSQSKTGKFQTMSLAGTQSAFTDDNQVISEAEAPWRQKEIEEQALVSRYIINCFKKVRVREYDETGPRTAQAGNLLHLRTVFTVDTEAIIFPQLTTVMLDLLHPTSAVCGMPKAAATDLIRSSELHNREFYSGYLGPVNVDGNTHLFVNLRTMKIRENVATLYAGCGITADSSPEKEWLETEMKCRTIEKIFD